MTLLMRNRISWERDLRFKKYNEKVHSFRMDFDKLFKFSTVNTWNWNSDFDLKSVRDTWYSIVRKRNEGIHNSELIPYASVGLVYLFASLPYHQLRDVGDHLTHLEALVCDTVYFFEIGQSFVGGKQIGFKDSIDLFGPVLDPYNHQSWLEKRYEKSCWWILYIVYERKYKLKPIYDCKKAQLIL